MYVNKFTLKLINDINLDNSSKNVTKLKFMIILCEYENGHNLGCL